MPPRPGPSDPPDLSAPEQPDMRGRPVQQNAIQGRAARHPLDLPAHDRGVRTPQRPRRPHPGADRRRHRRLTLQGKPMPPRQLAADPAVRIRFQGTRCSGTRPRAAPTDAGSECHPILGPTPRGSPTRRCRAGGSLSGERSERPVPARSFPCLAEGPAGAQDERDGGFGDGRFDEPAAANRVALAWNSRRGVMKVRVPDTGLSKPKTIMKVRMDRGFQVRGRPGCPGSAPPGQQPHSAGAGDMRLAGPLLRPQARDPWRTP